MDAKATGRWTDLWWLLFWGTLSSAWCVTAGSRLSATYDEPLQLQWGFQSWHTGTFKPILDVGTMPLPLWINAGPLYVWERWQGRPFDFYGEFDKLLPVARATSLIYWWLLLGYGLLVGRQIAGSWGGRLAVLLLACEPTLLANASLASADIALPAFLLGFFFHYRAGHGRGWLLRVGVPTLFFATAVLSKASALVFGLLGMAVLELEREFVTRTELSGFRSYLRAAFGTIFSSRTRWRVGQVFWLGLLIVFVFCGSDWKASPSFVKWARTLPDGLLGQSMCWLAENLRVFSNAGNALAYQIRRNLQTQEVFLLGHAYSRALWYYFPVALSIKLSVPLLVLPILLVCLSPRALRNWVCLIAGILLVYSLDCRVQIGVRLLLPLVVLMIVGLAAALVKAYQDAAAVWRRRALWGISVAAPAWVIWAAVSIWPNGLCYVNEIWGGPEGGYKLLSDSNYDWGQGLKELLAWNEKSGGQSIDVIYFGTDPRAQQPPVHLLKFFTWPTAGPDSLRANASGRYVAVGTSFVYGTWDENLPNCRPLFEWLRRTPPAARTSTFLIYDLRQADTRQSAVR